MAKNKEQQVIINFYESILIKSLPEKDFASLLKHVEGD